ncbi:MAG: cellulase family glycosylhydrolase [Candidatus Omnitrophota bacterium]
MKRGKFLVLLFCLSLFMPDVALAAEKKHLSIGMHADNFMGILKYAKELNVGIMRNVVKWQEIEPYEKANNEYRDTLMKQNPNMVRASFKRGFAIFPLIDRLDKSGYYWEKMDEKVKKAEEENVDILLNLRSVSLWGTIAQPKRRGGSGFIASSMPKEINRWKKFVKAVASRYKNRKIKIYYEIENEVNAPGFWNGTIEEYAKLLTETYKTIKSADPDAVVLHAAMACGITRDRKTEEMQREFANRHDNYLKPILETKAFDVVNVHNYYFPDREVNGFTFSSYIEHARKYMAEAGVSEKPIWVSEFGYVSQATPVGTRLDDSSPNKQAEWLKEALKQAEGLGVEKVFWLLLYDRDEPYFGSMGLMGDDGSQRPALDIIRKYNQRE